MVCKLRFSHVHVITTIDWRLLDTGGRSESLSGFVEAVVEKKIKTLQRCEYHYH